MSLNPPRVSYWKQMMESGTRVKIRSPPSKEIVWIRSREDDIYIRRVDCTNIRDLKYSKTASHTACAKDVAYTIQTNDLCTSRSKPKSENLPGRYRMQRNTSPTFDGSVSFHRVWTSDSCAPSTSSTMTGERAEWRIRLAQLCPERLKNIHFFL